MDRGGKFWVLGGSAMGLGVLAGAIAIATPPSEGIGESIYDEGGRVKVRWCTEPGILYKLEESEGLGDLTIGGWTEAASIYGLGQNADLTVYTYGRT